MEDVIKALDGVDRSLRTSRLVVISTLVSAVAVCLATVVICLVYVRRQSSQVYVLDQGHSLLALRADNVQTRDAEIIDHVKMFHMLFLNQAPNAEAIDRNMDGAFMLSDRSAYNYYLGVAEKGFYKNLVQFNIMQQAVVDSVKVDITSYPYRARAWVTYYLIYEKHMEQYRFESHCELVNTERSLHNTHGLIMEHFVVDVNEPVADRPR